MRDPRALAEQVVAEYILPLPSPGASAKGYDIDESAWTDRLLNTMKFLDERAIKALLSLTGLKAKYVLRCLRQSLRLIPFILTVDQHFTNIM
jgi:hypothetical protein